MRVGRRSVGVGGGRRRARGHGDRRRSDVHELGRNQVVRSEARVEAPHRGHDAVHQDCRRQRDVGGWTNGAALSTDPPGAEPVVVAAAAAAPARPPVAAAAAAGRAAVQRS